MFYLQQKESAGEMKRSALPDCWPPFSLPLWRVSFTCCIMHFWWKVLQLLSGSQKWEGHRIIIPFNLVVLLCHCSASPRLGETHCPPLFVFLYDVIKTLALVTRIAELILQTWTLSYAAFKPSMIWALNLLILFSCVVIVSIKEKYKVWENDQILILVGFGLYLLITASVVTGQSCLIGWCNTNSLRKFRSFNFGNITPHGKYFPTCQNFRPLHHTQRLNAPQDVWLWLHIDLTLKMAALATQISFGVKAALKFCSLEVCCLLSDPRIKSKHWTCLSCIFKKFRSVILSFFIIYFVSNIVFIIVTP